MVTLIAAIIITIIALAGTIMLVLFLAKNRPVEDEADEKYICTNCNDTHCNCHKDETHKNKQGF